MNDDILILARAIEEVQMEITQANPGIFIDNWKPIREIIRRMEKTE